MRTCEDITAELRHSLALKSIPFGKGLLSYRVSGGAEDMVLVFIHGAVGDSRLFRHQLKYFGRRYKTIAIDLPGHGRSSFNGVPSLDDFIDAVIRVLDEEQVSEFVLLGHSMGGGISLDVYRRREDRIRAMVLIATAPMLPVAREVADTALSEDLDALADVMVRSVFTNKVDLLAGFAKKIYAEIGLELIRNDIDICNSMDYTGVLRDIKVPVLIIANRGDEVIPCDKSAAMRDRIPGSRLVLFDSGGHVPFFENESAFNDSVHDFLGQI